ncbi:MAG: hypothetical protein HZA54_18325 [Planctomycetes bacterium]|nr:hypothetical protein [Planctomycetota bacterium]
MDSGAVVAWSFVVLIGMLFLLRIFASWIHVVRADEVVVLSGGKYPDPSGQGYIGYKVVSRGLAVKYPIIEEMHHLNLDAMLIPLHVERVTSSGGIPINVEATANVSINADNSVILGNAISRLLSKRPKEIMQITRETLEGNLRETIAANSPEEIIREKKKFRDDLVRASRVDLESMGLELISLVIQNIADDSGYLDNLTKKTYVNKEKEVVKMEAKYNADALIAKTDSERRQSVTTAVANDTILSQERLLNLEKETYRGDVEAELQQAQALMQEEQARAAVQVQTASVRLRELDNEAEMLVEARAKRRSAEIMADAQAEQIRLIAGAKNEILKRKLAVLGHAGDTAALVLLLSQLPELVRIYEQGARYTKVDKLLVMNSEDAYGATVNRGPEGFTRFLAQLESMTGLSIAKLTAHAGEQAKG